MKRVIILWLIACFAIAESNNQEGSLNTSNVNSTVDSNNTTTDKSVSNTYNGAGSSSEIPVASAIAPSYMANGAETCLQGTSVSLQPGVIGITKGAFEEDEACNRRRDAKLLNDLGMKVASIARMCQEPDVWRSMFISGTPCPLLQNNQLVVGKRAFMLMRMEPEVYIPDYNNKTKEWYDKVLRIGEKTNEEDTDDSVSISDRFRSSIK